ncbi:MAG: hypothetical protein AAFV29_26690, partial [Myxococcota bacterium]
MVVVALLTTSCEDVATQVVFRVSAESDALVDVAALRVRGCADRSQPECFQSYDETRALFEGIFPARIPIGPPPHRDAEYAVEALLLNDANLPLARIAAT